MDLVAGVEEDPEERIAQTLGDDVVQHATGLSHMQCLVPLHDRCEVGSDESIDVVVDGRRELGGIFDHETRPAVECTPHAVRRRELISSLDGAVAR